MFTNLSHQLLVLFSNKFSVPKTFLISSLFENDNNVFTTYHKKTISARKIQRAYRRYRVYKCRKSWNNVMGFIRFLNIMDGCGGLRYSN
jgi:hypothetical protein